MLNQVVKNYIEQNKIENYRLVNGVYTLEEYTKPLMLDLSVCFVYDFTAIGQVNSMEDFKKHSVIINSRQNRIAFANHCQYAQVGNAIQSHSDLVSIHLGRIDVFVPSDFQMYQQIFQSHFKYLLLTPTQQQ